MADLLPNYELEALRIELQISELQLSLKRMEVRKAEIADELRRVSLNEVASHEAIKEHEKKLQTLRARIPVDQGAKE